MICCSLQNKTREEILSILEKVEMAEIRMDLCRLESDDIEEIFMSDTPLVATCRAQNGDWRETESKLLTAIRSGANYADLEIEAPGSVARRISRACAECGTVLIRSYHDFEGTEDIDSLRQIADKCRNMGGEVIKIATFAHGAKDAARTLSLYKYYSPESLIAFAMGPEGQSSRLECLGLGAPFTYSSYEEDDATAPGQMSYAAMRQMLRSRIRGPYQSFHPDTPLGMPSSKSYAQRAIIAAAIAEGKSVLEAYSPCDDSEAAIQVAKALGAKVERIAGAGGFETVEITGNSEPCVSKNTGTAVKAAAQKTFNVGESGLLARLAIPLAAQLCGQKGAVVEGCGTLQGRPMTEAGAMMEAFGAAIRQGEKNTADTDRKGSTGIKANNSGRTVRQSADLFLPVEVKGPLRGGRAVVDGSHTSQLISGAMMALPLAAKCSTLVIKNPTSIPYLYITMEILRRFGVRTRSRMTGGREILSDNWQDCDCIEVKIKENQRYKACRMTLEADWSAAAVFMAAGAVFGKVQLERLDTSSLQADIMMLDILMDAGASISQTEEPAGIVTVQKAPLRPIEEDLSNCPDLFPVVAVLCAFCQGTSALSGVHRLVHKESDRAAGILDMLTKLGVKACIRDDRMQITGESLSSRILGGRLLKGGDFTSSHDHRMVMALSLASLGADSPVIIDDKECVAKSFPSFNTLWKNNAL